MTDPLEATLRRLKEETEQWERMTLAVQRILETEV